MAEIHHRVKNNLQIVSSLLDLQSVQINDPVILEMFRESKNRINSMALIHQTLYQSKDFSKVNLAYVLEELIPTLVESYSAENHLITFAVNTAEVFVPLNIAIPCSLIVNELITNILKHAFPDNRKGEASIDLMSQADKVLLQVSDTGIGIPAELDLHNTESLGMQLIHILADQIGADLSVEKSDPTRFTLLFTPVTA